MEICLSFNRLDEISIHPTPHSADRGVKTFLPPRHFRPEESHASDPTMIGSEQERQKHIYSAQELLSRCPMW
jgi:hypothetical protein